MEIKRNHIILERLLHNIKRIKDNWESILGIVFTIGILIEIYYFAIVIPSVH